VSAAIWETHLSLALGHTACLRGYSVLFTTAIDIIHTHCLRSGSAVEPRMLSSEIDDSGRRDKRWDARGRCHSLERFLCETLQRDGNALWRAEVIPAASGRDDHA
jgi:hypothetical protein